MLVPDEHGACAFYDRATGLCRVHRDHGPAMLPISCQQFPRLSLVDGRGTFISLSHFCPTAARLLESEAPLTIVPGPAAFPGAAEYDGLDARDAWPPLLRPDVLFDLDSYSRWEDFMVKMLAGTPSSSSALATIAAAAERLRAWRPQSGALTDWMTQILSEPTTIGPTTRYDPFTTPEALTTIAAFGHGSSAPLVLDSMMTWSENHAWSDQLSADDDGIVRRYLASKAFGSWCAYQSRGIRTLVAELYAARAVVQTYAAQLRSDQPHAEDRVVLIQAIRRADLLLVHGIERERFVQWLGAAEDE